MLIDALDVLSTTTSDLTVLAAGVAGYSDILDLAVPRDLGPSDVPFSLQFTTTPASATAGATINAALQVSLDSVNWSTVMETSAVPIANYGMTGAATPFLWRSMLPANPSAGVGGRYYRFAYTVSAALTAGAVLAQIGADWPRDPTYPRNYVA